MIGPDFKPTRGLVFAWQGHSVFASLIRRFTGSPWTHVGWFLDENTVLESDWDWKSDRRGVRYTAASEYLKCPERLKVFRLPISPDAIEKALVRAESRIGKRYDIKLILSLAWSILWGAKCQGDVRDDRRAFICSELIARPVFEVAAFRFVKSCYDIEATTPRDVHDRLESLGLEVQ